MTKPKKPKHLTHNQMHKLFSGIVSHRKTTYTLKKELGYHYPKGKEIIKSETIINGEVINTQYGIMYFEKINIDPAIIEANIAKKRIPKCNQS